MYDLNKELCLMIDNFKEDIEKNNNDSSLKGTIMDERNPYYGLLSKFSDILYSLNNETNLELEKLKENKKTIFLDNYKNMINEAIKTVRQRSINYAAKKEMINTLKENYLELEKDILNIEDNRIHSFDKN